MLAVWPQPSPTFGYAPAGTEITARTARIADHCAQHGVPLAAAALQFSMRDSRVTSTVVGITRPERIAQERELGVGAEIRLPEVLGEVAAVIGEAAKAHHLDLRDDQGGDRQDLH